MGRRRRLPERARRAYRGRARAGWIVRVYPCGCTRKELEDSALAIDGSRIYPGTCRDGLAPGKAARAGRRCACAPMTIRSVSSTGCRARSRSRSSPRSAISSLRRADGLIAYQLAVVVDDAAQGVTDVVRGADLLDSTPRQINLQRLLGYATPRYLHVPVAANAAGEKLSKQTHAPDAVAQDVPRALRFLGLDPPAGTPREILAWAAPRWDPGRLPRARTIVAEG